MLADNGDRTATTHRTSTQPQPLAGIRVLEMTTAIAGTTTGRYLAAHGAEVIKIESWQNPDIVRLLGAGWATTLEPPIRGDTGPFVGDWNTGKLSAGINSGTAEGRDLILRLAAMSDVFFTNLAGPVLPSVGLGYEDVRAVKPDIIYASMPGFGTTPSRYYDFRSWGPNQAPLAGLDYLTGWPDRPPSGIGSFSYPDYTNGAHAFVAVLAALRHHAVTGEGQFIDMSQFEATVACIGPTIMDYTANGRNAGRQGNRLTTIAPHGIYPCRGTDRWIALACEDDAQWTTLCALAGDAPFTTDSRFATVDGRLANVEALDAALADWTPAFTAQELATRLQERGVPAGIVADQADLVADPQLEARHWWTVAPHRRFGADLTYGHPIHQANAPEGWSAGIPCFGQDNAYVLEDLLGLTPEEHRVLAERGIVFDMAQPELRLRRPNGEWTRYLIRSDAWPRDDGDSAANEARPRPATPARPPAPARRAANGHGQSAALAGVRVLDLTDETGVYATKLLADLGADVIRVEPPDGDRLRHLPPFHHDRPGASRSLFYAYMNAGKRGVTLNLATRDGRELFEQLAATADAIVYSGSATSYDRLALDELRARYPRLVVTAVTPFGLTGPYRDWAGNDLIGWATGGAAYTLGDPDRPPVIPAPEARLGNILAGLFAAGGTLVALLGTERFDHGDRVDVSLQESALMATVEAGVTAFLDDLIPRVRAGSKRPLSAPMGHYPTTDGFASVLALMPWHWDALSVWVHEVTGDDTILDPAFKGGPQARSGGVWAAVDYLTTEFTRRLSKQELFEEGQRRGIAITPVNDPASLVADPQLAERDFWTTIEVDGEPVQAPGAPYRYSATPWAIQRRPPRPGEHNHEVFGQLGLDDPALTRLRAAGIV